MCKQLKNILIFKHHHSSELLDILAAQTLNMYCLGRMASELKNMELSQLISFHLFDLIDWMRRTSETKIDHKLSQLSSQEDTPLVLPRSIEELEHCIESYFASNSNNDNDNDADNVILPEQRMELTNCNI